MGPTWILSGRGFNLKAFIIVSAISKSLNPVLYVHVTRRSWINLKTCSTRQTHRINSARLNEQKKSCLQPYFCRFSTFYRFGEPVVGIKRQQNYVYAFNWKLYSTSFVRIVELNSIFSTDILFVKVDALRKEISYYVSKTLMAINDILLWFDKNYFPLFSCK